MRVRAHLWLAVFVCVQMQAMERQIALEPEVLGMLRTLQDKECFEQQFLALGKPTQITFNLVDWRTFGSIVAGVRASLGDGDYGQRVTNARAALLADCPLEQLPSLLEGLSVLNVPPQTSFGTAVVLHCAHARPEIGGCLGRSYDELSPSMQSVLRYGAHALLNDMLCHALREPGFTVDDPPLWLSPLAYEILKYKTPRAPEKIQSLLREYKDWRLLHCVPGVCALTVLSLSGNRLSVLPQEIGALGNLRELWLSINGLSSVPPAIGSLTNLRKLDLDNNKFRTLPPQIGALVNLRELWLSNNKLSALPPEIGDLGKLRELWLSNNKLSTLPPGIGALGNLRWLDLSDNKLSTLPSKIGSLGNLGLLMIDGNRFTSITSIRNALPLRCAICVGEQRMGN